MCRKVKEKNNRETVIILLIDNQELSVIELISLYKSTFLSIVYCSKPAILKNLTPRARILY